MKGGNDLDVRRFSASRPPAMVLGGLNITRALGLAGIPVIVAASGKRPAAFASRYCHGRLVLPPFDDRNAVADALLAAGERVSRALGGTRLPLFYGNDDGQRLVQDHCAALERHYALLLNAPDVAEAVIEKDRFQQLAASRGLPVPRMLEWHELEGFAAPVLVKPRTKFEWEASPVSARLFGHRGKARIFPSGRALLEERAALALRPELLIQEYLEGDDRAIWSFHGFADEAGRLLAWFIGRKIRTYPSCTGVSSFLELARDDEVAAVGQRMAASLPLKGVFKIDFKRDTRTGRLCVLEINARYNLWHYLGAANGVNLASTAYDYLVHGRRPAQAPAYRTGCRWIYLRYDWRAYRELAARGELGLGGWLASLAAGPFVCQFFRWSDPLPFLGRLQDAAAKRLGRLHGVLRAWRSTAS